MGDLVGYEAGGITTYATDFGPDFERVVLSALLTNPGFLTRFRPVVSPEAFVVDNNRQLVLHLLNYWDEYRVMPTPEVLKEVVRAGSWRDKGGVIGLIDGAKPCKDDGYVRDRLLSWARWGAIDRAMRDIDNNDPRKLALAIDKASRVGDSLLMEHTRLDSHTDEEEDEHVVEPHTPTPWRWLNERLHGGPELGDFGVVMTVINGGKTTVLCNMATHALRLGQLVVYGTFEDGERKIRRRITQCVTGMTVDEILDDPKAAKRMRSRFLRKSGGELHVKDFISRRHTVADMRSFVESVQDATGRKVDLVISDYADRYRPQTIRDQPRHEWREIFEDCKALGRELDVVHWTATQVAKNRVGKETIGAEHAGEAYAKMESPDIGIGFGQTMEDERLGRITMTTAKMRDASKHETCSLVVEWDKQRITDIREDNEE